MAFEIVYWRRRSSLESGQRLLKNATGLDLYAAPLPYLARLALTIIVVVFVAPDWMSWFRLTPTSAIVTVVIAVAMTAVGRAQRSRNQDARLASAPLPRVLRS